MHPTKRLPLLLLFLWSPLAPRSAEAQNNPPLVRWQRIRVATTDAHSYPLEGRFVRGTDSVLVLSTDTGQVKVLLTSVRSIWMHHSKTGSRSTAALLGAVGGLAFGTIGAAPANAGTWAGSDPETPSNGPSAFLEGIAGCGRGWFVAGGLLLGAALGLQMSGDHWESVTSRALNLHVALGKQVRFDPLLLRGSIRF